MSSVLPSDFHGGGGDRKEAACSSQLLSTTVHPLPGLSVQGTGMSWLMGQLLREPPRLRAPQGPRPFTSQFIQRNPADVSQVQTTLKGLNSSLWFPGSPPLPGRRLTSHLSFSGQAAQTTPCPSDTHAHVDLPAIHRRTPTGTLLCQVWGHTREGVCVFPEPTLQRDDAWLSSDEHNAGSSNLAEALWERWGEGLLPRPGSIQNWTLRWSRILDGRQSIYEA